jgi:transglutaminase TgpA-like protein/transglutaminase superfamily protein/uncharacterized protein DUF4129
MTLNVRMTVTAAVAVVLSSTVLYPVFTDSLWFAASIGAVATAAVAGALTRLRTLPVAVCLAASVVALLLYLNLVFEARHSLLAVIPTTASISRLWQLIDTGLHYTRHNTPPVPNLPGLLLLAAGGVGLTAALTDLIAVRLRSTALAGLPLLVLFTVGVSIDAPHSQLDTALVFCLGGAGYLAMLSADGRERIRVWGRLVSLWRPSSRRDGAAATEPGPDTRALAATGRRVGLASIVVALCAPLLIPSLHPSKLFSSGPGTGGTSGTSASTAVELPGLLSQTIAELRERPREVLSYTTSAPQSLQKDDPLYLQTYVYDVLTEAHGWQSVNYAQDATRTGSRMPQEPGLADTSFGLQVTTRLHAAADFTSPGPLPVFLPMPYPATQLTAPGVWMVDPDLMVYSGGGSIANQTYSVTSRAVDPTPAQLSDAPPPGANVSADVRLPPSYQLPVLKKLAETITAHQHTEYAKVNALATWLAGRGSYVTSAPGFDTAAGLVTFLTKSTTGVCVQFAYAMTVLARLLGIPARVASGFTTGSRTSPDHYVVTTKDSHAWTEVYFSGYGWIRFEPTPAGQGTASTPGYETAPKTGIGPGVPVPLPSSGATTPGKPSQLPHNFRPGPQAGSTDGITTVSGRRSGTPWAAIALAVIAAIALACGVIAMVAPPAQRALSAHASAAYRPRPFTAILLVAAAAGLVALALYRLLSRTSSVNLGAGWATVGIAFGAAAAVALIAPGTSRIALRRWRWMHATDDVSRAHAAWREFHDDLTDYGVTSRPSEPPRTLAARVTAGLPEPAREAVAHLALAEERASYAATPAQSQNLRHDSAAARHGLAAAARRSTRWRARLFPASLITALADTATQIPDRATARLTRRRTAHRPAN